MPTFKSKCLERSRFNFLCHFDDRMRGWSTVPCSPCPTDRTALRATTLPAIECACAWGATHRGYCAGRSQSGAWALTSYQWGLAWVGRKLGRVQGTHVMPLHWTCRSPGHGCGGPALPPCLGLVGEEATFTGGGLYPRHFPRQGSTHQQRPGLYAATAREDVLLRNFRPTGHFLQSGLSWKACDVPSPVVTLTEKQARSLFICVLTTADVHVCRCRIFIGNKRRMHFVTIEKPNKCLHRKVLMRLCPTLRNDCLS